MIMSNSHNYKHAPLTFQVVI